MNNVLHYERDIYFGKIQPTWKQFVARLKRKWLNDERYLIWKYLVLLRKEEYFCLKKDFFSRARKQFYTSRKNRLGNMISIKILPGYCGKGLNIHHTGIIINGYVGEDCVFHGRNVIGNNSMGNGNSSEIPHIGNKVDIGVGANIIGSVVIADGIKIGANALVNKSFDKPNAVLVGVPAKELQKNKDCIASQNTKPQ